MRCQIIVLLTLIFLSTSSLFSSGKFIVVFEKDASLKSNRNVIINSGATVLKELKFVHAVAIKLPEKASPKALEAISKHHSVARVEQDIVIYAIGKPDKPGKPPKDDPPPDPEPTEVLPWGIDRINADVAWNVATGFGVKVAILDTGIDTGHPDLAPNIAGGANMINPRKSFRDDNGHGTHVAGTIAAVDNDFGVVGVAPEALLYGIKVLDKSGSGWLSDILEGLQWCIDNQIDIVNMSLSASSFSQVFQDAITAVDNAGIVQVSAAGNESGAVSYPAAFPETIAVSATDDADGFAYYSNFGPEVDLAAPGSSILSTYRGGRYAIMSGTSMATPHVAGAAALLLEVDSSLTVDHLLYILVQTADDIGLSEEQQGAGLLDAGQAAGF